MNIKVKANTNEEFYEGDDRGFLVLVQNMIAGNWYNAARKAFKDLTFDCYEMDGDGDDMKICFEAYGDEIDEPMSDELAEIVEQAVTDGCEEANKSTDPTIADYGLDADFIIWDEPDAFRDQWSYVVNLSSKPKGEKDEKKSEFYVDGDDSEDYYYCHRCGRVTPSYELDAHDGFCSDCDAQWTAEHENESKDTDEKLSYEKGHKNSKGEDAPWVIRSHEDNRILASFADKSDAKRHLGRMKQYSEQESMQKETKKSEAFQCAYAQIGHDIPDKVIDSIMGELQDLLETYEKDSGGEALDVSCYGDGMDWELYVVAPVGKEKWLLNFLDGLGYAKLQDKWHTRLREHDVPVQHGGVFELTGNGLYKNPYPGTSISNDESVDGFDKYIKDVKAILKSKYDMDVDDKETSRLCSGWMDKLDAMYRQGKPVEDCAKAVAKFCGFAKDNESISESDGEMTEEAVLSLIDKLGLEVVNKWFDGNTSRPVFDCRDKGDDEAGETVCVAVEPPYEARVWFKDVNPRVNHYTEDIITIGDLEDTLKEFFHIDADESKTTEDEGWDALRKLSQKGELPYGNHMRTDGLSLSRIADEIRYDVATALDMAVEACEDAMLDYGYDRIYVAIADGKTPEEVAADIKGSKKTEGIKLEFQDTLRVPMWLWHAYNFNDTSDLTDEEIDKFNQFKEEYKDCHLDDKGEESYFSSRNDFDDLGGPVYDVDVYKMTYKDEKMSESLSSKSTYPFSFKFKFASPRVIYAVRNEVDNGDYNGANLNCSDDDATECEVFTDSPKVIYDLLENVCKRYNETYDGDLIPDDLKNKFQIGFGLVKTDDPNLDDTALRFGVAINTRQPDGVMVSGELDNVVDFLDEMK